MVIITGASDGLGLELARLFVADGKRVINISRRPSPAARLNIAADLTDATAIGQAAQVVIAEQEPLETVINCAGILSVQPLAQLTAEEVTRVMAVNVTAPMLLVSALTERIKKDGTDIVNISSTLGHKGYPDLTAYGTSKWALRGFSANLRAELENTGCRVLSVCPGAFTSGMFAKATSAPNTVNKGTLLQATDIARCIKQLLDLPKTMEVSEIVINRRDTV
jgi:NAD(P)-dependent dehydrogenase (short-subunit alcohol dehydrogenase family)